MDKRLEAFQRLLNIMDDLRAQCPWDKKQTMQSLCHLTIEETYELGDAILDNARFSAFWQLMRPEPSIEATKGNRNEVRDRCLLLLMFRHGLRASEACGLRFS